MVNLPARCLVLALVAAPSAAIAGTSSGGKVTNITGNGSNFAFYFQQNGVRAGVPACASSDPAAWALDTSTASGQTAAAIILTAFSLGKPIFVQGTGSCPASQPSTEGVAYVTMSQ